MYIIFFLKEPVYHRHSYIKKVEGGEYVHDQVIMVGYRIGENRFTLVLEGPAYLAWIS